MRKNKSVAEVAELIGYVMIAGGILSVLVKGLDPLQYSSIAQVPVWGVVMMPLIGVICLLADWYFRPEPQNMYLARKRTQHN